MPAQRGNTKTFQIGSGASVTFGSPTGSVSLLPRGKLRSVVVYLLAVGGPIDIAIGLINGDLRMILESGTIRTDTTSAQFYDSVSWQGEMQLSDEPATLTALVGENDTNSTATIRLAWDVTSP